MNFDWSNSWLFLFLLVPIIIHFLNFVRTKKVYFSKVQFISQVKEQRNKVESIKKWVLLLTRLLLFLALIFSFIKVLNQKEDASERKIIFIDNSPSSELRTEGNTRVLDLMVNYLSNGLESNEEIALNTSELNRQGLYFSKEDLITRLSKVEPGETYFTWREIQDRVTAVHKLAGVNKEEVEVIVLSDFQTNMEFPDELASVNKLRLIKVGSEIEHPNMIIDSVYLSSRYVVAGQKATLNVVFRSVSEITSSLKLLIGGVQVGATVLSEPQGEVQMDFTVPYSGINKCELELDDITGFDNKFYFTVLADESINITVLSEDSSKSNVSRVYKNESVFNINSFSLKDLSLSDLESQDLIILESIQNPIPGLLESIQRLSNKGVLFCYIPSIQVSVDNELDQWFLSQLGGTITKKDSLTKSISQYDPSFLNNVFDGKKKRFDYPKSQQNIRYSRGSNLLEFNDDAPYLTQEGRFFGFSSSFDESITDFHRHALFVPVLYKMAFKASKNNEVLYYKLDQEIAFQSKEKISGNIMMKGNTNEIDVTYYLSDEGEMILDVEKSLLSSGFYSILLGDSIIGELALNLDKKESETIFLSEERIQSKLASDNIEVLSLENKESIESEVRGQSEKVPFWKYSLTLALILLFLEIVVIKYWR